MANAPIKSIKAVIDDHRKKPIPTQKPGNITSPIPALNRPPVNEFDKFQQNPQTAGPAGRPPSPAIRPGIMTAVFGQAESAQSMIKPDRAMVLSPSPTPTKPKLTGGPTTTEMREALTVLQGVFGPKPGVVKQKKLLGMKEEMTLEDAQQIVVAGAKEHLGLAIWDLKYGLTEEQIKLGLEKLDPNRSPELKPTTEQIKEAGKPKSSAKATSGIAGAAGIPAPSGEAQKFVAFINEILEPPTQQPSELDQLEQILRQTRMQPLQDQLIFQDNELGPLNTIYRAFRGRPVGFEGMPGQGGLGSQAWQAVRGFSGFGGGSASAAAAGTAPAAAGVEVALGGTAGAGAAAGAGAFATAAGVILGVLIIFFLVIFISKNIDLAEIIPIQGTGGGGSTHGSFGTTYDFEGVCWPIAGSGVQISETPAGHAARGDLAKNGSAIDIAAPEGTPVQSSVDGAVVFAGPHGMPRPYPQEYGGLVVIQVNSDLVGGREDVLVFYAHLSSVQNGLTAGQPIAAGDPIGESGNTGNSTGPHLHMEAINMSIYSLIPDWQSTEQHTSIPDYCEGGSEQ
jgi:hypothetical protein